MDRRQLRKNNQLFKTTAGCMSLMPRVQGRVTSYYGQQLEKYTSLKAHPDVEGPVQEFLFSENGVFSLASGSVHFMIRRGLTQWHLESAPCQ